MNLNSLIIAVDGSCARLFRTAQTNLADEPVELVEVEAIPSSRPPGGVSGERASKAGALATGQPGTCGPDDDSLKVVAEQIAERAAQFAHYHFCSPVIVAGPYIWCSAINTALAREMPSAYTRSVIGDVAQLTRLELLHDLQKRGAFTVPHDRYQA